MRVALSYRHDDNMLAAAIFSTAVKRRFGDDSVFLDLESIPPGVNFLHYIEQSISGSDVLVVVIGANWDARRLSEPDDVVRFELEVAARHGLLIVPALVPPRRTMPTTAELPESLGFLSHLQAWSGSPTDFERDVGKLIDLLPTLVDSQRPPPAHSKPASTRPMGVVEPPTQRLEIATPAILLNIAQTWREGIDADELYEITRGSWRCWGDRREATVGGHAFGIAGGIVRSAYRIARWRERTLADRGGADDVGATRPRMMFEGEHGCHMLPEDLHYLGLSVRHLMTNPQLSFVYVNC